MQLTRSMLLAGFAVVFGLSPAFAAKPTMADCNKLAAEVTAAIRAAADGADLKKARGEQATGAYFCGLGSFTKGIEHFNSALALLQSQQASANPPAP